MSDKYSKYKLSDEEHNNILFAQIEDLQLVSSYNPEPTILIISGQPGCGKSTISDTLKKKLFKRHELIAIINGDDYRKAHPQSTEIFKQHGKDYAKYTDPDARVWTSELLEWAVEHKKDIIFESTLRNREPISTTIKQLKGKGYKVIVAVMSVPYEISRTNIVLRYENGLRNLNENAVARWTDFKSHDEAYKNIPNTVDFLEKNNKCIDSLMIFKHDIDNKLQIIYPGREYNSATTALTQTRLEITAKEKQRNRDNQLKVIMLMKRRNAAQQEIQEIREEFKSPTRSCSQERER